MELIGAANKLLFYLNDPIVSFDQNGVVVYRNQKAKNLSQLTEVRIKEELIVSIFEFIDLKRNEIESTAVVRKVEILADEFEDDFFELNIRFDEEAEQFYCHFKNITEKIELENQIKYNRKIINEHIEELTSANDVLKRQNSIIQQSQEDAKSGLRYGKVIQDKINASIEEVNELFPDSFTLYRPQNYIGGDLIWAQKCKLGKVIAVVDCMGHGVPGAMLAMSVFHFLNSALKENNYESVTELLCEVTNAYHKSFFELNTDQDFADTFDISICVVDEDSKIIRYRGIKRPLLVAREGNLTEFKGERVSVVDSDASEKIKEEPWDKVWPYKPGDKIYLFSDGFSDQFGGVKNKKFKYVNFKKFVKQVSQLKISIQRSKMDQELWNWQNTYHDSFEQTDDITVVGIEL